MIRTNRFLVKGALFWSVYLSCFLVGLTHAAAATFYQVGDLSGGAFNSRVDGISADGTTVVGSSVGTNGTEAFRWTTGGGMAGLGVLDAGNFGSSASTVSQDGSIIYGQSNVGANYHAFRWTSGGGMTDLGVFGVYTGSNIHETSWDGTVAVGDVFNGSSDRAVRWTSAGGWQLLGDVTGGVNWNASSAISGDGNVIGGFAQLSGGNFVGFRWTSGGGMQSIGNLGGTPGFAYVHAIDYSGDILVGDSINIAGDTEAFMWTSAGGMVGLGDLAGGAFASSIYAMVPDGSRLYGRSIGAAGYTGIVWDSVNGMRDIRDVLTNDFGLGSVLVNFDILAVTSVSADGLVLAGTGWNRTVWAPEGWVVVLPEPATYAQMLLGLGLLASVASRRFRVR